MRIESRPVSDLTPYPDNPRVVTDEAVSAVAESIRAFGWRQPIVVDEGGIVLVGHTRLQAAKSLGMEQVPSWRLRLRKGG